MQHIRTHTPRKPRQPYLFPTQPAGRSRRLRRNHHVNRGAYFLRDLTRQRQTDFYIFRLRVKQF